MARSIRQAFPFVSLLCVAGVALAVPLLARERFNLVHLPTPREELFGTLCWIAAFLLAGSAAAWIAWLTPPARPHAYVLGGFLAVPIGLFGVLKMSPYLPSYLCIAGCIFAEYGSAAAVWASFRGRRLLMASVHASLALTAVGLLFLLTWAAAFFE